MTKRTFIKQETLDREGQSDADWRTSHPDARTVLVVREGSYSWGRQLMPVSLPKEPWE